MLWQPLVAGAACAALDGLLGLCLPEATIPVWGTHSPGAALRLVWGTAWPFAAACWRAAPPAAGRGVPPLRWAAAGG